MSQFWNDRFYIKDDIVFWKTGRNKNQKAGWDNGKGYLKLRVKSKGYFVHKIAYAIYHGYYPEHQVDHRDHNRQNNAEWNLDKSSHLENSKNQSLRYDSPTKTLGVCYMPNRSKWKARIGQKHLGYFDTENEAITERKIAEKELDYHENHGQEKGGTTSCTVN